MPKEETPSTAAVHVSWTPAHAVVAIEGKFGVEYAGVVFAIAESPKEAGTIWAGTNDGLVQITRDGGKNWTNVTKNIPNMLPWGTKIRLEKQIHGAAWRLVASRADGILCHKPSTVSGGGKSEISKPISDAILVGPVFVADFKNDFDQVAELLFRDYSNRFKDPARTDERAHVGKARAGERPQHCFTVRRILEQLQVLAARQLKVGGPPRRRTELHHHQVAGD